jgi:hypothetical protein
MSDKVLVDGKEGMQSKEPSRSMAMQRHFEPTRRNDGGQYDDRSLHNAFARNGLGHSLAQISIIAPSSTGSKAAGVQTKLAISQPGDAFEQEADRVAEQVMRMPEGLPPSISEEGTGIARKCPKCRGDDEEVLQAKEVSRQGPATAQSLDVPPIVHEVLRSPGQSLDVDTRTSMEGLFGHNFAKIRVYSDAKAAESSQAINALAYTVGQRIVFGEGSYAPKTREGSRLLAHELTHTIQQDTETIRPTVPSKPSSSKNPHEKITHGRMSRVSRQEKSATTTSSFNLFSFLEQIGNPQYNKDSIIRTINQLDKDTIAMVIGRLNVVQLLKRLAASNAGIEILGLMKEKISIAAPGKDERAPLPDKIAEFNLLVDALTFRDSASKITNPDERLILDRINNAIVQDSDFSKYGFAPVPLRFPVEIFTTIGNARDGGVYYDPNLNVNSGKAAGVTVADSIRLSDANQITRTQYPLIFIKLGPKCVLKDKNAKTDSKKYYAPAEIRSVMWHEFVHYRRFDSFRKPDSQKSPEEKTLESEGTNGPNAEVEAYSVQLAKYFDTLGDSAIEEWLKIFANYLNDAHDPVFINQAIERIYLAVASQPAKKARILNIIRKLKNSKLNILENAIATGTYVQALPVSPVPGKAKWESHPGY